MDLFQKVELPLQRQPSHESLFDARHDSRNLKKYLQVIFNKLYLGRNFMKND
jgi:hypothetical protein